MKDSLFDVLVAKRGAFCELCLWRRATQKHHCIVGDKRKHPEYTCEENCELTCAECHIWGDGYINSYEHKCSFWQKQKERGYLMESWYSSLNLKSREFFE